MPSATIQDFALPDPSKTQFPVPFLVQGPGFNFESFHLVGIALPGQWLLVGCTRTFGWQIQKGNGLIGATMVPIGDDPLTLKFAVKIWTNADATLYRSLLKTILKKPVGLLPGSPVSAGMGIDHPAALDLGVNAVVVKSVSALMNPLVSGGGRGPWTAEAEFYEYRKPLPAVPTPTTTYPGVAPPNPPATTAVQIENAKLAAEAQQLAAQQAALLSGGPKP